MQTLIIKAVAFVAIAVSVASVLGWDAWLGFMIGTFVADIMGPVIKARTDV